MKRHGAIGIAAGALMLISGGVLYLNLQQPANASSEYADWAPGAAAIREKIGPAARPTPGMTDAARREQFCTMFKERFRQHEPAVAVGLRFLAPNKIKLMCPARMEPFLIDQIALAAWREARADFGKPVEVDIYDTFIGTTRIKIGELRCGTSDPGVAYIRYDFSELNALNRPRIVPYPPIAPVKLFPVPADRPGRTPSASSRVL